MVKNITATLTRCHQGRPLAVLESQPFNGLEIRPADLLALAESLIHIAHAAVEHNSAARVITNKRITLEVKDA